MARNRRPPADDGGDDLDLGELLEEVRGIRAERDELRQAVDELRQASTPTQRRRAERDVAAHESELAKALRSAGYHDIGEADLEELRAGRRRAEYEQWLDERLEQIGAQLAAEADDQADDDTPKRKKRKTKPARREGDDADDVDDEDGADGKRRGYFA